LISVEKIDIQMSVVPPLSTGYEAWLPLSIDITSDHQCISTLIKERKHNWTCRELNTTILEQLEEAKPSFHTNTDTKITGKIEKKCRFSIGR
jgi:hypothetical protein